MKIARNINILAGVGASPRLGDSTQQSVLYRLETAIKCQSEIWYFLAYQDQFHDPAFRPILNAIPGGPNSEKRGLTDTLRAKGLILSILPPEDVSNEDWESVTRFYHKNSGKNGPLLIGQKLESETIGVSPVWQDARFTRKGTYAIGNFIFHVLELL